MRSILVVNPKGGCGKTTIATTIASYYAAQQIPTALVDLDPQQSSMQWLRSRPKSTNSIQGFNGLKGKIYPNEETQCMVYDAPARTDNVKVARLIKLMDVVIIPVLPSAIDMRVTATFVADMVTRLQASNSTAVIGVVANRTHSNYNSSAVLLTFLKKLNVPFVGTLRNTQNYIKAAETGLGIFEMPMLNTAKDRQQWQPIIRWIDGKRKLK